MATSLNRIIGGPNERMNLERREFLLESDGIFTSQNGSEKPNSVAQATLRENLERVKATQTYGIRSIYYSIFLPLKQRIAGLSKEEKTDLDLYKSHQELCTLVDHVKKAYELYLPAAEAVSQAPKDKVAAANLQKLQRSGELIHSYNALLDRATAEADRLADPVSGKDVRCQTRNEILKDVQELLSQDNGDLIFHTVNIERARVMVSNGDPAQLSQRYNEFVRDFVTHVQQAVSDSGDNMDVESVTNDFILGLASIPELENNFEILSILANLSPKDSQKIAEQEKQLDKEGQQLVQYFIGKLNDLINSQTPIDKVTLENIQHKGISLASVWGSNIDNAVNFLSHLQEGIHSLKDLETSKKELDAEQKRLAISKEQKIAEVKNLGAKIDGESMYTVNELAEFLMGGSKDKLQKLLNKTTNKACSFVRELLELKTQIAVLEKRSKEERAYLAEEIKEAQRQAHRASEELQHFITNSVDGFRSKIESIEQGIIVDDKKIQSDINELHSQKKFDLLIRYTVEGRPTIKEHIQADLESRKQQLQQNEASANVLKGTAAQAEKKLADLQAEAEKPDSKETRNELALRRGERDLLAHQTSVKISGNLLLNLSELLEIGDVPLSAMGEQLKEARRDESAVEILGKDIQDLGGAIGNLTEQTKRKEGDIEEIKNQFSSNTFFSFDANSKKLAMKPEFFRDEGQRFIEAAPTNNLDIARKITAEVSQAIAMRKSGHLDRIIKKLEHTAPAGQYKTLVSAQSGFVIEHAKVESELPATPPMNIVDVITDRLRALPKLLKESPSSHKERRSLPVQIDRLPETRDRDGIVVHNVKEL